MTDFLSGLGSEAIVGDAFYNLYDMVDRRVDELDHLRRGNSEAPNGQTHVSGTQLEMAWSREPGDDPSEIFSMTQIDTWPPRFKEGVHLLSRTQRITDVLREPSQVIGHRACESTGDYSMRSETNGIGREVMVIQLGNRGLRRTTEAVVEPFGINHLSAKQKIGRLDKVHRERFEVVSGGILDSIAMVELLKEGANTEEVFASMGRPFTQH
jgi:hypothetical protein